MTLGVLRWPARFFWYKRCSFEMTGSEKTLLVTLQVEPLFILSNGTAFSPHHTVPIHALDWMPHSLFFSLSGKTFFTCLFYRCLRLVPRKISLDACCRRWKHFEKKFPANNWSSNFTLHKLSYSLRLWCKNWEAKRLYIRWVGKYIKFVYYRPKAGPIQHLKPKV